MELEQTLVEKLFSLRAEIAEKDSALKSIKSEYENGVSELVELLRSQGKEASAKYEGIGFVSLGTPQLYASYKKENQDDIFSWVKSLGRDDLIKDTIHPASFSSFVSELLGRSETLPEIVSYYLKPKVTFYDRS